MTPTTSYVLSGAVWLTLALLSAAFEWFALAHGQPTLSQWVWHQEGHFEWFRWVIFAGLLVLIWHFVLHKL